MAIIPKLDHQEAIMIAFKGCPRCGGDVCSNYDDTFCVQCGWRPVAMSADVRNEVHQSRLRSLRRMQRLEAMKAPVQLVLMEV